MNNLHKSILDSNMDTKTKKELLKTIDKGYGLYFSRNSTYEKHPILKFDNIFNNNYSIPHIAIQGDNLGTLKAMHNAFTGEFIDFIYIDPPYNTRTKLNYEDNRIHSNWLDFMEQRLKTAHDLLSETGSIAISIDDNELFSLKLLMDSIFGENNFIHNLVWRKKSGGGQDAKFLAEEHEYILIYAKNKSKTFSRSTYVERDIKEFNKTFFGKKAKIMKLEKWGIGSRRIDAPTMHYPIKDPDGNEYFPVAPDGTEGRWRKKPERLGEKNITWQMSKGKMTPYEIIYYKDSKHKKILDRTILYNIAENTQGTKELTSIFGKKGEFDYPKPTALIEFLIKNFVPDNGVILDFFAGSGTTLEATAKYNKTHNSNIRSIIVNINEKNDKIFNRVTSKRAKYAAKKYDVPVAFLSLKEKKFEFEEDYSFELSKNIIPHILIGLGGIITKHNNIFLHNNDCIIVMPLNNRPEVFLSEIVGETKTLCGEKIIAIIRDDQILNDKAQKIINSNNIEIRRTPRELYSFDLNGF